MRDENGKKIPGLAHVEPGVNCGGVGERDLAVAYVPMPTKHIDLSRVIVGPTTASSQVGDRCLVMTLDQAQRVGAAILRAVVKATEHAGDRTAVGIDWTAPLSDEALVELKRRALLATCPAASDEQPVDHILVERELAVQLIDEVRALRMESERRRQDRADALSVTSRDGLLASEWVARTGKAERERDEARARLAEVQRLAEHVVETHEVLQLTQQVAEGGEWVDKPTGEWVCGACGEYGDAAEDVAHAESCVLIEARAALGVEHHDARDRLRANEKRNALLEDVADKVNDAIGGLAIGASVEVVMAPVRAAMKKLHEDDDA